MIGSEVLLTIAEVAVAFAGFASIVVAFQHGEPSSWPPAVPVRLRAMVESSLGTMFCSLLPFQLHYWGIDGAALWRASSAISSLALAILTVVFYKRARPFLGEGLSTTFTLTVAAVALAVIVLQLSNVLGMPAPANFGNYLAAILWSLGVTAMVFLRLVIYPIAR